MADSTYDEIAQRASDFLAGKITTEDYRSHVINTLCNTKIDFGMLEEVLTCIAEAWDQMHSS